MNDYRYIFLDIDGVLATDTQYNINPKKWNEYYNRYYFDYKCVKVFNQILSQFDNIKIVISSDWKDHYSLTELRNILKLNNIDVDIVGVTDTLWGVKYFKLDQLEECRANEILDYVKKHNIKKYIAIDDLDLSTWLYDENFVITPRSNEGIKQSGIKDKIIKKLKK
jgi:hypothetical protein